MSRAKTDYNRMHNSDTHIADYATKNGFDHKRFSVYHTKLISPNVTISFWTGSGIYFIEKTDFRHTGIIERQGERGRISPKQKELYEFLDHLFFAADML